MKRLVFLLGLIACGGSTEPKFPAGTFTLYAVNGVRTDAPFDNSTCGTWYEGVSYMQLQSSSVTAHFRTHPNCSSIDNVYDDAGSFSINGTSISVKLARQSVPFTGIISANKDTLSIAFRDVWHPDQAATAQFTFVRM